MRTPASMIRWLLVVVVALGATGRARADDPRAEARAHFTAGMKDYRSGDYQAAIQEFSTAQQLAPADLNNYNLALCYDKLGQAEPAIQYYQAYLAKVPDAAKRPEIEASIARLQAALQSAAAKRDEEAKAAAAAKAAEDAKAAEAAKAAADAKAAEAAKQAAAAPAPAPAPGPAAPTGPAPAVGAAPAPAPGPAASAGVAVGVSSTGTPGTGESVSTGDAQLDRVNAINLDQIRDQRMGTGAGTAGEPGAGPAEEAPPPPAGANGSAKPAANNNVAVQPTDQPAAPKETPVYKKWWFWAIVAVSGYVVYEIATSSSTSNQPARLLPLNSPGHYTSNAGITLLHF